MNSVRLDWKWLRKFLSHSLSDATTYQYKPEEDNSLYVQVNQRIRERIDLLLGRLDGDATTPIIFIAHSLGAHVMSNYIWEARENIGIWSPGPSSSATPFQRLDTLQYIFTAGCNIPLFVSGQSNVAAIGRGPSNFEWYNCYDRDDVLGWPLKDLSDSYDETVAEDIEINAGGLLGLTPLSHTKYWTTGKFLDPVSERITSLNGA